MNNRFFLLFFLLLFFSVVSCENNSQKTTNFNQNSNQKQQLFVSYTVEQIDTTNNWAYRLQVNGRPFIYQKYIPSVPGHQHIKTKIDAQKLAELMQKKIYQGYDLPYIKYSELDSLNINYTLD